ncbi:MAG: hypothetical protein EOP06_28540 [Proteobacteria bacterium]|nr:MAG: hypothetical protein EOP06_28540 [Pseudomonadota bacterium]
MGRARFSTRSYHDAGAAVVTWRTPRCSNIHGRSIQEEEKIMMLKEKRFQTHRGLCTDGLMENTAESLMNAKKHGSEMVEFDVRCTKDYVVV